MTKYSPDRKLNNVMAQQLEDNQSTSASSSDSEVDAKRHFFEWSSGAEEADCEMTSDEESIPSPAKPEPSPLTLGGKMAGSKTAGIGRQHSPIRLPDWKNIFGRVTSRLRCVGRARKVDMASDFRAPPGLEKGPALCSDDEQGSDTTPVDVELPSLTDEDQRDSELSETLSPPPGLDCGLPPGLSLPPGLTLPQTFAPPPGLEPMPACTTPPGLSPATKREKRPAQRDHKPSPAAALTSSTPWKKQTSQTGTPPWRKPAATPKVSQATVPKVFTVKGFHKELTAIFKDLSADWNVGAAVGRVRAEGVPKANQATEFTDILTRASEERRGVVRRLSFAFAAGLVAADPSAFEKDECLAGLRSFFEDVFPDLCDEVPRLRSILANELLPTLYSVLPAKELASILPPDMRRA